ncbi:helix-turn-helix domain-containing protein [Haladaptatus sp. NG-SE-30]
MLSNDFELELERLVPLGEEAMIPLVWLREGDPDDFETHVGDHPSTRAIRRLTHMNGEVLFEVRWSVEMDGFLDALRQHSVYLLEGEFTDETWDFRLRFVDRDELVEFSEQLTANLIPITLNRLYNPGPPVEITPVPEQQRATVERAYQQGYFEVPRKTTIKQLAAEEGISDSAFSQRLRRSLATVIEGYLLSEAAASH